MTARRHSATVSTRQRDRRRIAFPWYGGKVKFLGWLLPLLPATPQYCEPFAGSASVLLNRDPSPLETLNDLDSGVVNFFRVLRDREDELVRLLARTPYSREEFELSDDPSRRSLEDARRFYVRVRQSWGSKGVSWSFCVRAKTNHVRTWCNAQEKLHAAAERLRRVQIEHAPALAIIGRYDHRDTLFYCDPPYPHESRVAPEAYRHEMTDDDHRALAEALRGARGKVAISGYRCALMDRLYRRWRRVDCPAVTHSVHKHRPLRESLWLNW